MKKRVVEYVQQVEHLPFKDLAALQKRLEVMEQDNGLKEWAFVVHDQDVGQDGELVAPHVHLAMSFTDGHSLSAVAKLLGDKPERFEWPKTKRNQFENLLSYLTHRTAKAVEEGKHQYDPDEVVANFDYGKRIRKIGQQVAQKPIQSLEESLLTGYESGQLSYQQALDAVSASRLSLFRSKLDAVRQRLQQRQVQKRQRAGAELTVVYIYGASATGKTSLAKALLHNDYYLATANRDPWQDYQDGDVILDDLKPGNPNFGYGDLLTLLDPFTAVKQLGRRYANVYLLADTVVITSVYSPFELYEELVPIKERQIDTFKQFQRRLSVVYQLTMSDINEVSYNGSVATFKTLKENPYSELARPDKQQQHQKARRLLAEI